MRRGTHRLVAAAIALAAGAACTSGPPPPEVPQSYEQGIRDWRAEKDRMFRSADPAASPLTPADKAGFTGLPYYAIDPAYRVPASLDPDPGDGSTFILLPTSTSQMRRMRKVGVLRFRLDGQPMALTAFADAETRSIERLFVPFRDQTSADETYGGGRYLDLDRTPTGLYDLDFNRAYHPYCVYNIAYECPVPPAENTLDVPIRAGERLPPG